MLKQATSFVAVAFIASAASAGASYGFTGITNNNPGDIAIGETQFTVDVKDAGSGSVEFLFRNSGPLASSMVQLYWEDAAGLLSSTNAGTANSWSTTTPLGVNFNGGQAKPGHLPGSSPKINDLSIQALNPKPLPGPNKLAVNGKAPNGVGPNEDVSIFFTGVYADVVSAIENGGLIVGTHAQGFRTGGSESFVTGNPPPPTGVPSPTAALTGMALLGVITGRRRRRD